MNENTKYALLVIVSVLLSVSASYVLITPREGPMGPPGESIVGPQGIPGVPCWSDEEFETIEDVEDVDTNHVSNGESDSSLSGYDYFPTDPGRYVKYHVSDTNSEDCEFEIVFQKPGSSGFFSTLTQTDDGDGRWSFNAIYWRESDGVLCYGSGCPGSNRGHIFRNYFSIPPTFKDGDTWDTWSIPLVTVTLLDNRTVSCTNFEDCIKISSQTRDAESEFYLARGVGIIEIAYRRRDGTIFTAKAIEWGRLNSVTISGTLTLDGIRPAEGHGICLSNCGEPGTDMVIVDEDGGFELEVFGHSILIRYGPIREDASLYQTTKIEQKFDNVTGDITGLELSMGLSP